MESHRPGLIPNCVLYSVILFSAPYFSLLRAPMPGIIERNELYLAYHRLSNPLGFLPRNFRALYTYSHRTRERFNSGITPGFACDQGPSALGEGADLPRLSSLHLFCVTAPLAVPGSVLWAPSTAGPLGFIQFLPARWVLLFIIVHIS